VISEIGNKQLLRSLGIGLDVQDVKQYPSHLDVDSVKVVAAIDVGSLAIEPFKINTLSTALAATTGITWECVGTGDGSFPAPEIRMATNDRLVIITSLSIQIQYDLPGLAADVAAGVSCDMLMHRRVGLTDYTARTAGDVKRWYLARAGQLTYRWSFPFFESDERDAARTIYTSSYPNSILVAPGDCFMLTPARQGAGAFPANTTFFGEMTGFAVPKGCKPPWF